MLLSLLIGQIAGAVEDRTTSYGCQAGIQHGMECGFGIGRFAGVLGAVAVAGCLVVLAVASLILQLVGRHRQTGHR